MSAGKPSPKPRVYAPDERLVAPDTRFEIIDGQVRYVPPSREPHGNRHSKLSALLEAHVIAAYDVASDMLTRTSVDGDMAPDASVYPVARDPVTGGRLLEELAFEVVSTQTLADAKTKAMRLHARGVRRVFLINVGKKSVLEWIAATATWEILPKAGAIEDRVFAVPLAVDALVHAAKADDAMATALLAKRNPVLVAHEEAVRAEEAAEMILTFLRARGLAVSAADVRAIRAQKDLEVLRRWSTRAATCERAAELWSKKPRA